MNEDDFKDGDESEVSDAALGDMFEDETDDADDLGAMGADDEEGDKWE